jgi:hypothetical protein
MINYLESKSDMLQESFVLSMLKGKKGGYYVEVGAGKPLLHNNTFLLETVFGWHGVGLDINTNNLYEYSKARKNPSIFADAIKFDYRKYFRENNFPNQIDFLQIDVDTEPWEGSEYSGNSNLLALINIPLTEYRFSVIIFEHDCIANYKNEPIRDAQREILSALGYVLLGSTGMEDWWVDPNAISKDIYSTEYFRNDHPAISRTVQFIEPKDEDNEK